MNLAEKRFDREGEEAADDHYLSRLEAFHFTPALSLFILVHEIIFWSSFHSHTNFNYFSLKPSIYFTTYLFSS